MLDATARPVSLRGLLALAWPIILNRVSQVIIGLTDAVLVAHLGASALAATGTGALNAFVLFILPMGVTGMVSSFSSQLFGRNDLAGARRYAWYGLAVAAATEVACLASIPLIRPALSVLPYDDATRALMAGYLSYRLLSGGAAIGIEALSDYFGGLGNTRPGMVAGVSAMAINVVITYALVDGRLGAPAMGVSGAALASSLATGCVFLGFLAYFLTRPRPAGREPLRVRELVRLLRFGLPAGFNYLFEFLAFVFFINVVVAGLGTTSVAALNVVFNLNSISFMPSFAMATAGSILVGQAIGAGRAHQVGHIVGLTLKANLVWQGAVGLLYLSFPRLLMAGFARGDGGDEVLRHGAVMLAISSAWQLFDATATTLAEALRAAGDTLFPTAARLVIAWAIFAPGAYYSVTVLGWTDRGATVWIVGYLALLAGALAFRFRSGAWKNVRLVEPAPAVD